MSGAGVLSEGGGVCLRRREGGEDLVVSCGVCCGGGGEWVWVWVVREREVGQEAVFGVSLWSRALERGGCEAVGRGRRQGGRGLCGERASERGGVRSWRPAGKRNLEQTSLGQAPTICLCAT